MTWDWQQLVALVCVAAAMLLLGRRVWRFWQGTSRAGSACATCPVHEGSTAPQAKPLVTLDLTSPARSHIEGVSDGRSSMVD
jgi:hypothetical protein